MANEEPDTHKRRIVSLFLREGITVSGEALDTILKRDDPIDFAASLLNRLKDLKYKPIILTPEEISQLIPQTMTLPEKTKIQKTTSTDKIPHQKEVSFTRNDFLVGPLPLRKGTYTIKRKGYTVSLDIKKPQRRRRTPSPEH